MRFSDNQLLFAGIFLIAFILIMIWAYRNDVRKTPNLSRGVWKVVAAVAGVFLVFYLTVRILG